MSIVTITFTGSGDFVSSGVPREMTINSNVPSTIYFTVDGSAPSTDSPIYIDSFLMPDNQTVVTLSAFAVDFDGYVSPVLTQVFGPDQSQIDVTRNIGQEGIVVDRWDDPTNIPVGFGPDGYAVAYSDIPDISLDEVYSSLGRMGLVDGRKVEVKITPPTETAYPYDDHFVPFSSASDVFFNPYAKTILIDNREDSDIQILNRPFGSLRPGAQHKNIWSRQELRGSDSTYVSGGKIRSFYSAKNNAMVSYYYDNNTNRWVKSIQNLPSQVPNTLGKTDMRQPLVFQWISGGRHSTIPI